MRSGARRWKKLPLEGRHEVDPKQLDYMELCYEELIESPSEVLENTFSFLGLSANVDEILFYAQVYKERIGAWRSVFSREYQRIFAREAGCLLIELWYEKNKSWVR